MQHLELTFPATLEQQQFATIAVANIAGAFYRLMTGDDEQNNCFVHDVELAVGEACSNAVKYCDNSHPEKTSIHVCFELNDNELIVIIKDRNEPFDFNNLPPPDFKSIPERGYGVFIMKEKMDQVTYERSNDMNIITMKKTIVR